MENCDVGGDTRNLVAGLLDDPFFNNDAEVYDSK